MVGFTFEKRALACSKHKYGQIKEKQTAGVQKAGNI
jgi:hypothetical protein